MAEHYKKLHILYAFAVRLDIEYKKKNMKRENHWVYGWVTIE